jgi:interleukin-1 receptor-associated kinase 1
VEDEAIPVEAEEMCNGDESFSCTLVGKIWTESPYNVRAFKQTMTQAWRCRNPVEIQDLNRNLFLFKFATKKEAELVCRNGPWSFDRNLLILNRISGDEQPSKLEMNRVSFWVRVYDLPLKLRSEGMAKKLGNILGNFEEMDMKECNRMGKFLRIRVSMDLRKPLKRKSKLSFQGKDIWVDYKYERLPNFCFACGRIGHQMRDCEEIEDHDSDAYSELEEKDLAFGPWLRASPLPKVFFDVKKESSSGTCSKSLFPSTSNSKGQSSGTAKVSEEEVEQHKPTKDTEGNKNVADATEENREVAMEGERLTAGIDQEEMEGVAESLGAVSISIVPKPVEAKNTTKGGKGRKWVRHKESKPRKSSVKKVVEKELGKRSLMDVVVAEGTLADIIREEKKKKGDTVMEDCIVSSRTVVLEDQHRQEP